ncbi:polysaccharide pyruvyl transferase family protein [Sphingobacterium sp. DN00404]|uniref:Polysaccharide pyruvyl transferase family protein n=1 Tax=Sphingobacterium micropteri TaxID=2763501 RepID=A0ABR7YKH0_9SPHI|nr:polysaccharide pyruvyl transferase family protein [Sphingobacterium micropteri]MBD1431813.1 polysaccharide pyruvyl transferase family protein [Sphingobacterium micropteri]
MKIGIMTFWESKNNYGQILQLFALQSYLKKIGHKPFLIKYYRIPESKVVSILKPVSILRYLKRTVKELFSRDYDKERQFDLFKKRHIIFGEDSYYSIGDLNKRPPHADAYVVGSDQVWNNKFSVSAEAFLLSFGGSNVRKVAYAASFGQTRLDNDTRTLFNKYIREFNAISVREKSGLTICDNLGVKEAKWVLDPTFLFSKEEWNDMLGLVDTSTNNTIFIYTLGNSEITDKDKFVDYAKQIDGVRVVHASANNDSSGKYRPTIPQWVGEIKNAKLVVTTSFHGMVFSLINNTNFIVLPNTGKAEGMNERVVSLLSYLGLIDHVITSFSKDSFDKILKKEMPWEEINEKLEKMNVLSKEFLHQSLK